MLKPIADYIKAEWSVLKTAPFTFVTLSVLWLGAGFAGGMLYYSGQVGSLHEQIGTKDGEIGRYRVALGIDPASKGALIELTNQELQAKSATTVRNLRALCSTRRNREEEVQREVDAGKVTKKEQWNRRVAIDKELGEQFVRDSRADAFNVDNELRRRLGPQAVAAIIGITPSLVADDGTRIDITTLAASGDVPGFDVFFTCILADAIEQMAKLLPADQ
jgi:hypothetical protein